jgi:CHAD domain-containing protein
MHDLLPTDGGVERARDRLRSRFEISEGAPVELDRTFYDTFDGLLHAAGLTAVYEHGQLALIAADSGDARAAVAAAQPADRVFAVDLEPGPMRAALEPVIDVRALLVVAHVHSRVLPLGVVDSERKTVVRMTLEEPAVVHPGGRLTSLRPRLRVDGVRGYDTELERVEARLLGELQFAPAEQTLVDEAVLAAGREPAGVSAKIDVPLRFEQRADAAAAAILERLLEVIEANVEGTIADTDTEFLHDLRVAVRRSRSVQRELRGAFAPQELPDLRAEFRWLQQATGDARDLDVYVLEFDAYRAMVPETMRSDLDPLLTVLRNRRLIARGGMVRALRSERARGLLARWRSMLQRLPSEPDDDRPVAALPIGQVTGERIRKVYRRMVKMGRAIDHASPPEDYHELRKRGKELRYLLELFASPLYPAEVVKPMIRALKALQDVLGRHQDREIQVATVRSLRDEVSALPGGPAALMSMGVLVERLDADQLAARSEFAERFLAFASNEQRKLVEETFG